MARAFDTPPSAPERVRSVTEFTAEVKAALEAQVRPGWVRGEVSNLRLQASGHVYFSLKDAGAQVSAVMFRGDASRQALAFRDGMQVVAFGEISVYEPRGSYQLIVRALREDGVGRLQREFEALKQKLTAEGLFDRATKKPLPELPSTVAFITSPTGAAVQDFCRILVRRGWRGRLVIVPAKVQGEGAAAEIAARLAEIGSWGPVDVVVVGRGGGSIEDLWAFNEEVLVRAVAACPVPVVSAVGHETDFTLCDFAASVRAETPSAAAELISSHFVAANQRFDRARRDLVAALQRRQEALALRVDHLASRLKLLSPAARIERGFLRLEDAANRLDAAAFRALQLRRDRLTRAAAALARRDPERRIELESHRLLALWKRLQAASPASVLQRGYAIVRDAEGRPVMRAAGLSAPGRYEIQFGDGSVPVRRE